MMIGMIDEANRVPWVGQWSWSCSGARQRPPNFIWRGSDRSLEETRAALEACLRGWLEWAGLELREPTRWKSG